MRKTAGILMIIGALFGFITIRAIYLAPPDWASLYEIQAKWLSTFWAIFVGYAGLYTLKKKRWVMSLASSILLLPFNVLPFLIWADASKRSIPPSVFGVAITGLFFAIGILPLIFVFIKKQEWES